MIERCQCFILLSLEVLKHQRIRKQSGNSRVSKVAPIEVSMFEVQMSKLNKGEEDKTCLEGIFDPIESHLAQAEDLFS